MFDYIDFLIVLAIIINAVLVCLIVYKAQKSATNLTFVGFISSAIIWELAMIGFRISGSYTNTLEYGKLLYGAAAVIPFMFLLYCVFFTELHKRRYIPTVIFCSTVVMFFVVFLCLFSNTIVFDISIPIDLFPVFNEKRFQWGPLYIFYLIYQNSFFVIGFVMLYLKYKQSYGLIKSQIQYIFIGTFLAVSISFITNLFLPSFQIFNFNWMGQISSVLWAGFITYTIVRHRFLSITSLTNNAISILLNSIFLQFLFYGLVYVYQKLFGEIFTPSVYIISFFVGIFVAIIINKYFKKTNDLKLFTRKYDPKIYLNQIRERNYINQTTTEILNDFINLSKKLMGISNIILLPYDDQSLSDFSQVVLVVNKTRKRVYIVQEEDFHLNSLQKEEFSAIIVIYKEELPLYILIFHHRNNYSAFDIEDINSLYEASEYINLAINKTILSDEQRRFSEVLQQKLDVATKELQEQKAEVEDRYRTERDMIGIMGHELRTPLTTARGFLEIVLTKSKQDPNVPISEYLHYLDNVYSAFKREVDLVQTMLSTSHVDNHKLNLDLIEVDLEHIIQGTMQDFNPEAEKKGLILEYHPSENLPHIKSDPSRTIEVTNNLVSNAVKYTDKGRIDVYTSYDDQYAYFSVKDTGQGISEQELPNIGKKFYRVENYLSPSKSIVRPGGTGLGMYIVKAIMEAAGGQLRIESKIGEGSNFTAVFVRWDK